MLFAQVTNGVVDAILEADHAPTALPEGRVFVPTRDRHVLGGTYDAVTETFTPPLARAPRPKRLSRFEFMSLLTTSERVALRNRAATDTTMADALNMLELVGHVECVPQHLMVTQMLGYVQSLGIMTAERRAAFEAAMAAAAY